MIAWRQNAGSSAAGQGRKPAEPVARSASLDRMPHEPATLAQAIAAWTDRTSPSTTRSMPAVARGFDLQQFFVREPAGHRRSQPVTRPKPMRRQTLVPTIERTSVAAFILPS
jgi:hypothetical protein